MSVRWDKPASPEGGVVAVRTSQGPAELTHARLQGKAWRRSSYGHYVPADVDRSTRQRIVEAAARLPGYGAVGGWAAAYSLGVHWLNGERASGPLPVLLNLGDLGKIRPSPGVTVCRFRLTPADILEVDGL